ncbi:MAG: antitoxin VapB family protein [Promethearchaeota archaeon]
MASKMISVREEVYKKLLKVKTNNESFSELFERLLRNRKKNPLAGFGNANELSAEYNNLFENSIHESRKIHRERANTRRNEMNGER